MSASTTNPAEPPIAEYHRALAGEHRRIPRGILAIALLLAGMLLAGLATSQLAVVAGALLGDDRETTLALTQAANSLALALLIPLSMLIQRLLYGIPARSLHSVASRFRFGLLGRTVVLAGPLWVVVILLSSTIPDAVPWSAAGLVAMFVITLVLTPLQAAGEEYGLRGLVFRVTGSWTRGARAGLVLGIAVSSVLFVAIHLSGDPWRNLYYLAPAISFALITWRTGGLEVSITVHALNNALLFLYELVMHSAFPSLTERASDAGSALLLIPAAGLLVITAAVWIGTRRAPRDSLPR
jgi:uncharacterized protein